MGSWLAKFWPERARSVREDWLAWLPAEKNRLFDGTVNQLEVSYWMLSVTLNEALTLRGQDQLAHAQVQAGVSADLFDRLAAGLLAALGALEDHGRHFGTLPNVAALHPEFFRGETAQYIARKSSLLQRVLFASRSKFFHKLRALADIVEELQQQFRDVAEEIADWVAARPGASWETLDVLHYDLNTCLREVTVMLKSFLCALPNEEVPHFQKKLQACGRLLPVSAYAPATRGSP